VQISVYVLEENPDVTTKQSFVLAWKGSEKNESGRWESVLPRITSISYFLGVSMDQLEP